jgi:hypothetical protein
MIMRNTIAAMLGGLLFLIAMPFGVVCAQIPCQMGYLMCGSVCVPGNFPCELKKAKMTEMQREFIYACAPGHFSCHAPSSGLTMCCQNGQACHVNDGVPECD